MNRTLLAIFLFLGTYLNGQIRGTVFDDKKEPIIGASVRVVLNGELSNIGTVTDFDGAWSLDIFNYPVQVEVNSMGFAIQRGNTGCFFSSHHIETGPQCLEGGKCGSTTIK